MRVGSSGQARIAVQNATHAYIYIESRLVVSQSVSGSQSVEGTLASDQRV